MPRVVTLVETYIPRYNIEGTIPTAEVDASLLLERVLEHLPPYLSQAWVTQRLENAFARELQRLFSRLDDLAHKIFPQFADDAYGTLGLWELNAGLPVAPPNMTVEQRRGIVLANLHRTRTGSGAEWVEAMSTALNTNQWSHVEGPGPQVLITVPYAGDTQYAATIETLGRRFTPAHVQLTAAYDQGFLIGISRIGIEPL